MPLRPQPTAAQAAARARSARLSERVSEEGVELGVERCACLTVRFGPCVCVLVGVPGLRATDQSVMFARRLLPTRQPGGARTSHERVGKEDATVRATATCSLQDAGHTFARLLSFGVGPIVRSYSCGCGALHGAVWARTPKVD